MKRSLYQRLLKWKISPTRKPLMLYGARQVGKTYLLKEFGKNEFGNMIYINCYMNHAVKSLFSVNVDVNRLLLGLSALSGEKIERGRTFIFLDEVQEIPEIVAALKYFCEDAPWIHLAVAGSLLGVMNMEGCSFPTGKVEIMHLYPMTFMEFLQAMGEDEKVKLLYGGPGNREIINSLSGVYTELLRQYYFVGGMPEAVLEFIRSKDPNAVRTIHRDILTAYETDIAKHAGNDTLRARMVLQSLPTQLARENKKFVFGAVKKGARASDFDRAIQWLVDASLIYKVSRLTKVQLPLPFYMENDSFKLFLLDVGLLGALAQAPPAMMLVKDNVFDEFKGAFSENFVVSQIKACEDSIIAYYAKANSTIEIDFVVQTADKILPIEVKAEENVKSKSLRQFITVDNADKDMHGYRFSMKGFQSHDWMDNIPLFAVEPFIKECSGKD